MSDEAHEFEKLAKEIRQQSLALEDDPIVLVERLYKLWWNWADFSLFVISPTLDAIFPPTIIEAQLIPGTNDLEFVYPIHDYGYKLMTSKAEDMFSAGMSMHRLYNTLEKMFFLLIERLRSSGVGTEVEVQVAFGGHELPQRKAFEILINLKENLVVTNFEPGSWGERYLATVKKLAEKGYGYPPEAPRNLHQQASRTRTPSGLKR